MHLDFKPHAGHAQRLAHVFLPVDDEFLVEHMQNLLVVGNLHRLSSLDHAIDVQLRDFLVLDRHHPLRIEALDVIPGDTRVDLADFAVRHQLGLFQSALYGIDGGLDIHHHALLQPARRMTAHADDLETTFGFEFGDDRHNL